MSALSHYLVFQRHSRSHFCVSMIWAGAGCCCWVFIGCIVDHNSCCMSICILCHFSFVFKAFPNTELVILYINLYQETQENICIYILSSKCYVYYFTDCRCSGPVMFSWYSVYSRYSWNIVESCAKQHIRYRRSVINYAWDNSTS